MCGLSEGNLSATFEFSAFDEAMMRRALDLAALGKYTVSPNPCVGCVITRDGKIIGEGFHKQAGTGHAEVNAIASAGGDIRGADVYVTLEPCSHYGRTPPCADALVRGGVRRVVASMVDPNPKVSGRGLKILQSNGIITQWGLLSQQSQELNVGFLHRMRTNRPYVRLKLGCSIDGRIALANGVSKWITCPQARIDVQEYRARSSAILTTSATVSADNPYLNVRMEELPESVRGSYPLAQLRQPDLVLLDSNGVIPASANIFKASRQVIRCGLKALSPNDLVYDKNKIGALAVLMEQLGALQINDLWVEAGSTLAGSLISQSVPDEIILYMAPKFLGSDGIALAGLAGFTSLDQVPFYEVKEFSRIGTDLKVVLRRKND